jgi:hypothetical protein
MDEISSRVIGIGPQGLESFLVLGLLVGVFLVAVE